MLRGILSIPSIRRVVSLVRPIPPRSGFMCQIISSDPFILHTKEHMDFELVGRHLGERPAHFLVSFSNSCEDWLRIRQIRSLVKEHLRHHPSHQFLFLANSQRELDLVDQSGLAGVVCGSNCFVDEMVFQINSSGEKEYDAVYDSQLVKEKRHYLATKVASLALVSYVQPSMRGNARTRAIRQLLNHARWFNDPYDPAGCRFMTGQEVSACYNKCRTGLCLSAVEGQMYASVQYLLCGLPVVTTQSRGGRDQFFDREYVVYAEDTPQSVSEGVRCAIDLRVDPAEIRGQTLKRMQSHRQRYIEAVQAIYDEAGVRRNFAEEFKTRFFDKMVRYHSRDELIKGVIESAKGGNGASLPT